MHNVVIMGNYQVGKTTLTTSWAGIERANAYVAGPMDEYLSATKLNEDHNEFIHIRGTPVPFGRMLFHNSKRSVMEDAKAFIIVFRNTDLSTASFYVRDIKANTKKNVPVLLIGTCVRPEDKAPLAGIKGVENTLLPSSTNYIVLELPKIAAKDAAEMNILNEAINDIVFKNGTVAATPDIMGDNLAPVDAPIDSPILTPILTPVFAAKKKSIEVVAPTAKPGRRLSSLRSQQPQKKHAAQPKKINIEGNVSSLWDSLSKVFKGTPAKPAEENKVNTKETKLAMGTVKTVTPPTPTKAAEDKPSTASTA